MSKGFETMERFEQRLQIAQQTQVARPTVSQVINKLLDLQKIERIGQGRAVRYRVIRAGD